jgi:hypothetical protein
MGGHRELKSPEVLETLCPFLAPSLLTVSDNKLPNGQEPFRTRSAIQDQAP